MILKQVIHDAATNSVEAIWADADDKQAKCHSYADVQMDMLAADLGADAAAYADLMAAVVAEEIRRRPPPPTAQELALQTAAARVAKVEALLASKGVTRLLVQLTIEVSEDKAKALAASYGMTDAQALAYAYSKNKTYRECKDLETAIRAIETAP